MTSDSKGVGGKSLEVMQQRLLGSCPGSRKIIVNNTQNKKTLDSNANKRCDDDSGKNIKGIPKGKGKDFANMKKPSSSTSTFSNLSNFNSHSNESQPLCQLPSQSSAFVSVPKKSCLKPERDTIATPNDTSDPKYALCQPTSIVSQVRCSQLNISPQLPTSSCSMRSMDIFDQQRIHAARVAIGMSPLEINQNVPVTSSTSVVDRSIIPQDNSLLNENVPKSCRSKGCTITTSVDIVSTRVPTSILNVSVSTYPKEEKESFNINHNEEQKNLHVLKQYQDKKRKALPFLPVNTGSPDFTTDTVVCGHKITTSTKSVINKRFNEGEIEKNSAMMTTAKSTTILDKNTDKRTVPPVTLTNISSKHYPNVSSHFPSMTQSPTVQSHQLVNTVSNDRVTHSNSISALLCINGSTLNSNPKNLTSLSEVPKLTSRPTHAESSIFSSGTDSKEPLARRKILSILQYIDPTGLYVLESDAEQQLIQLADDFSDSLVRRSMKVAQHRYQRNKNECNINTIKLKDMALVLKKDWGVTVPGIDVAKLRNIDTLRSKINPVGLSRSNF